MCAWLLHLKRHGTGFWQDWLQLLPTLDQATAALGMWSEQELQQLQLPLWRCAHTISQAGCQPNLLRLPVVLITGCVRFGLRRLLHVCVSV